MRACAATVVALAAWLLPACALAASPLSPISTGSSGPETSTNRILRLFSSLLADAEVEAGDQNGHCEAEQVHLALTGDETEMVVTWATASSGCVSEVEYVMLRTGHNVAGALQAAKGVNYPLQKHISCKVSKFVDAELASKPHIHIHNARLISLVPGEEYRYTISGASFSGTFRAAPRPGPEASMTFITYGDMGEPEDKSAKSPHAGVTSSRLIEDVGQGGLDMVLHVGDLAYAHGESHVWDKFFNQVQPVASHIPYMVSIGNYEYDYTGDSHGLDPSGVDLPYRPPWFNGANDSGGECGLSTVKRFMMPGQPLDGSGIKFNGLDKSKLEEDNPPFWYDFRYGPVHFVILSGEHSLESGSWQHSWLMATLTHVVDRTLTPWLIVGIHRPLYVPHPHHSNKKVAKHMRKSIEEVLNTYKVDLVVSGHIHSYTRSCPAFNWGCVNNNELNVTGGSNLRTVGDAAWLIDDMEDEEDGGCDFEDDDEHDGGGCDTTEIADSDDDERFDSSLATPYGTTHVVVGSAGHKLSPLNSMQPAWVQYAKRTSGYGRVTVQGGRLLRFEFVKARNGKVLDQVELRR